MTSADFVLPVEHLDALIRVHRAHAALPGVAVGLIHGTELVWNAGVGWADLDSGRPPDEGTLFRVASITKTFTATAILQLRDEGRLGLDDSLVRHLPEFARVQERGGRRADVTIRRLLTHRAGLVTESPPTSWEAPYFPSRDEILEALDRTGVVLPADTAWKYSNLGFALLGEVVARSSDRPYAEYLASEILEPLGLTASTLAPTSSDQGRAATGYVPAEHEVRPRVAVAALLNGMAAAGGLYASVRDLARWLSFQLNTAPGERAPSRPLRGLTLEEMHRPAFLEPDWSAGQALAWRVSRIGDRIYHSHGGGIHGFSSNVAFNKPAELGVVVLANLWPSSGAPELALSILDAVLDAQSVGESGPSGRVEQSISAQSASIPALSRSTEEPPSPAPESIRPYLGRFRAEPGITVHLDWRADALRLLTPHVGAYSLHAPAVLEAVAAAPGTFRVLGGRGAGEEVVFERAAGGPASFELGGFVYRRAG